MYVSYFLKLYFIDYVITVVPIFSPLPHLYQAIHSLRQFPHQYSCPWVICVSCLATLFPIQYFTSPWYCVTTYLYFLIPSPLHLFSPTPSHLATIKTLTISMILSVLVCLVCFFRFTFDRYVFNAILLFLVLIFFFLNKSL